MTWQTIKTLGISVALFVPALSGMRAIEKNDESLPVHLRHRGYTPLHIAAYEGNADMIAEILASAGTELIQKKSVSGSTALHLGAEQGHLRVVEALIAKDQSGIDIQDNSGCTPLACAAANGHRDVLRCLISKGARIDVADRQEYLPLFQKKAQYGDFEARIDRQGYLPFHKAAQYGDLEALKILLPDGASESHTFCNKALYCAVKSGKTEALAFVMSIAKGRPDPEGGYQIAGNTMEATPLLLCAAFGYPSLMEYCLAQEGSRIDERDSDGATALHYAARYGQVQAAQFLLERNPELINCKKKTHAKYLKQFGVLSYPRSLKELPGGTALHEAAKGGHKEVVTLLLQHGAEIDARTLLKETSLHLAAKEGHAQVIRLLIAAGASLTAIDDWGLQPLHLAARGRRKGCVEALLGNKADIEAKTTGRKTPLLCAREIEVIKCLLQNGANIKFGNALSNAISCGFGEAAINYFFHHPEIELRGCVFAAAESGNYKAMDLLIKRGVSLNIKLSDGRTVLHCAAKTVKNDGFGMYGTVRLLIRAGAGMLCRDDAGNRPLDLCIAESHLLQAHTYFENRRMYLAGYLHPGYNNDFVFQIAAEFLDIPVLEALKDQLGDRLMRWQKEGMNLLMVALCAGDLEGVNWLLDRKICNITDVDRENHDALWLAIKTESIRCNISRLAVINRLLAGGARVTEDHLLEAASSVNQPYIDLRNRNDILMRLLITYRYSQRPAHERLSMYR